MTAPLPGNPPTSATGEETQSASSAEERGGGTSPLTMGARRGVPEELVVGWNAGDRLFLVVSLALAGLLLAGHVWLNVQRSAPSVRITSNPIANQTVPKDGAFTPSARVLPEELSVVAAPTPQVSRDTPAVLYRIDVNVANWVAWAELEGIGETLARRIVEDRDANGPFTSVDDVQRVRGIGAKTLAKMRPHLYVVPPTEVPQLDADVRSVTPVR